MTPDDFWAILRNAPNPKPVFYRAYYDEHNIVNCYTMEDLPGNYIEITQEIYTLAQPARIVDGQLIVIKPAGIVTKLHPANNGTPCHPTNVSIVVDPKEPHTKWTLK